MPKFTQKWALATLLEPVEEGAEFFYKDFPLHITLAGVFATNCDGETLAKQLTDLLVDQKPLEAKTDAEDRFGPNREVVAMKLRKTLELMNLYNDLHSMLLRTGAVFNEPQYEGNGYIPHSTFQKHAFLNVGDSAIIDSVSIIDLFPNSDGYQRKIFKTIKFLAK